jgi:Protein of unknown function (DUF2490)
MRNTTIFFLLVILGAGRLLAQSQTDTQQNIWYMYFGNHRISDRWGIHSEYQWRRENFGQTWQQSLMRLGVDYYSKSGAQITGGYGWIVSFPYGKRPGDYSFNEHRIWEQLILKQKAGLFYFHHRYRLEQRFIEVKIADEFGDKFIHDSWNFRQRARYRLYVTLPITHKELEDNTLFLGVYNEVFINFGSEIGKIALDQNRLYLALGWQFNKKVNLQLGYLNHYVVKPANLGAEWNHTLQVSFTYNFDFRKS